MSWPRRRGLAGARGGILSGCSAGRSISTICASTARAAPICVTGDALDLRRRAVRSDGAHASTCAASISHRTVGPLQHPERRRVHVAAARSYPVTHAPAYCLESVGPQCYTFSVLGHDAPLFTCQRPRPMPPHIADETNLPVPIRRRALEQRVTCARSRHRRRSTITARARASPSMRRTGRSRARRSPIRASDHVPPISRLAATVPSAGQVAVDPVLRPHGFPTGQLPEARRGGQLPLRRSAPTWAAASTARPLFQPLRMRSTQSARTSRPAASTRSTQRSRNGERTANARPEPSDPAARSNGSRTSSACAPP